MIGSIQQSVLSIQSKPAHRKGREERKGRGLAISNWQLAFVSSSHALGYTEKI
jgi:hypothetical protein